MLTAENQEMSVRQHDIAAVLLPEDTAVQRQINLGSEKD
jgi:hypothetical protein